MHDPETSENLAVFMETLAALFLNEPDQAKLDTVAKLVQLFQQMAPKENLTEELQELHVDQARDYFHSLNFQPDSKAKRPCESIYTEGHLNGTAAESCRSAYESWNFAPDKLLQHPQLVDLCPDHVGYQLAFLSIILRQEPDSYESHIFAEGRRWLEQLAMDLQNTEAYHRILGRLLQLGYSMVLAYYVEEEQ